jgi:capsid protein
MAETIPVAFVHGYTRELRSLMQQRQSYLRSLVTVEAGLVGKTYNFERLGASDLQTVNTRHSPTPILNPVHSRRQVTPIDKAGAILLDPQDQLKMVIEPSNKYAMNHAASVNRFFDDRIIAAATGNSVAVDDADGTSNVTLASWDGGSHVLAPGTGLTFEVVNQVNRVLNEDDVPFEDRVFVASPQGIEDLLAEPEVTSSDFSDLMAIKQGQFNNKTWMGFKWVMSNRLASAGLVLFAFHKSAIGLGIWEDIHTEISERSDLNYAKQIYARVSAGAVRIEEAGVVQVTIV